MASEDPTNPASIRRCVICGSTKGTRNYAVTIDDTALRANAVLCTEHGERYLLRVGHVLGSLERPYADIFKGT